MSDMNQAAADLARRQVLLDIPSRTKEQEDELDRLNVAIEARDAVAQSAPAPLPVGDPPLTNDQLPGEQRPVEPAVDEAKAEREAHMIELGSRAAERGAAASAAVPARERADSIYASAAGDVVTMGEAAKVAIADADAAKLAAAPDADAKIAAADVAHKRSVAMIDAAGLASVAAVAAKAYETAAENAASACALSRTAFAAASGAEVAGTADFASLAAAANEAEARAASMVATADAAGKVAIETADAADKALAEVRASAMTALPEEHRNAFAEMKEWMRTEIALFSAGHSAETRRTMNP